MSDNFIITGTSGTGKSALIEEIRLRGYSAFTEAQREVLADQLAIDGPALPSKNPNLFLEALLKHCERNIDDSTAAVGPSFFDRGIPDIGAYAIRFELDPTPYLQVRQNHRYNQHVFMLAPWQEIFATDKFRGMSFDEYTQFHQVIQQCYSDSGYKIVEVPRASVQARADFVLRTVSNFST